MDIEHTIKVVWNTRVSYPAAIIKTPLGHLCGYVKVPKDHPCYGKASEYDAPIDSIACHGGITYAGFNHGAYPVPDTDENGYWIGFDCAHCGDGRDPKDVEKYLTARDGRVRKETIDFLCHGHVWTVDEVTAECESIATQLKEYATMKFTTQKVTNDPLTVPVLTAILTAALIIAALVGMDLI